MSGDHLGHGSAAPDDTGCTILHVDMDAFYASVAIRERPDLAGVPVIVGGSTTRGVVLSANYQARAFGVHSAMPMTRARRMCPQAVVLAPRFTHLSAVSAAVMQTFRSVTPVVEPLSLDEAFLDVSGSLRRLGSPAEIAEQLQARIADEQRITCSIGVAATTSVAKLASCKAKPDGLLVVPRSRITAFLHPLPVEELWGVGDKTAAALHRLGLTTVGDLAHTPIDTLRRALGPHLGAHLHALAWGSDGHRITARPVADEPEHSIGSDETFARDTDDPAIVRRELLRLTTKVAARVRSAGMVGRTVTLRVRFADFTTITRSRTIRDATDVAAEIYQVAVDLYAGLGLERARIRLVGVRLEGLTTAQSAPRQLVLGAREHGWADAERAVDRATSKFGSRAVRPATLIGQPAMGGGSREPGP